MGGNENERWIHSDEGGRKDRTVAEVLPVHLVPLRDWVSQQVINIYDTYLSAMAQQIYCESVCRRLVISDHDEKGPARGRKGEDERENVQLGRGQIYIVVEAALYEGGHFPQCVIEIIFAVLTT